MARDPIPLSLRKAIRSVYRGRCQYCGAEDANHIDHIVPVAASGLTEAENLTLACGTCNQRKGAMQIPDLYIGIVVARAIKNAPRIREKAMRTTPWDPTALLTSDEAIQEYLEIAFEDGDTKDIAIALGNIAKAKGMTQVAKDAGITREALYKSLSEKGDPKLSTLLGVMKALGLRFTVTTAHQHEAA